MKNFIYGLILFFIAACRIKASEEEEDFIDYGSIKCTRDGEYCPFNTTCKFTCQYSCLNFVNEPGVHGSAIYSSESSICKSALHDLRISKWDSTARKVTIRKYEKDECYLESSVRFGFSSQPVQSESCSVFEFVSPRISESILDVVSIHKNFLVSEYGTHEQYCFAASNSYDQSITFETYLKWQNIADNETINTVKRRSYVLATKVWTDNVPDGFQCIPSNTTLSVITSIAFRKDAWFHPSKFTVTVNKNENITLKMKENRFSYYKYDTVWKKDNILLNTNNLVGKTDLTLINVHEGNSGIYSLGYDEHGSSIEKFGAMQLIVRSCPGGKYGPGCSLSCRDCSNGGICHDITGECVCAPGFNGLRCEYACQPGFLGKMCNIPCPSPSSYYRSDDICRGYLICLPSPYGCSCAPGYKGLSCIEEYPVLRTSPRIRYVAGSYISLEFYQWSNHTGSGSGVPKAYEVVYKTYDDDFWITGMQVKHPCEPFPCFAEIYNLRPITRYTVAVVVVDESGHKKNTGLKTVTVDTLCDRPSSPPMNVRISSRNQTMFIKWDLPPREAWNCRRVQSLLRIRDIATSYVNTTFTDTTSYSFYSDAFVTWIIQVCLLPAKGREMKCANSQTVKADGPVLTEPIKMEIVSIDNGVSLAWIPPKEFLEKIYYYTFTYVNLRTRVSGVRRISVSEVTCKDKDKRNYHCYKIKNLSADHLYKIEVSAFLKSAREGILFKSFTIQITNSEFSIALVFAVLLPLLVGALIAFFIWQYLKNQKKKKNTTAVKFFPYRVEDELTASIDALDELDIIELESLCEELTNRIRIEDLAETVKQNIQNNKIRKEFTTIPTGQIYPCNVAKLFENKPKNRYGNILPYDHSRVTLSTVKGDPFSNYIHANYVHGYEKVKKYIATQGPLMCTVNDFWRMVWSEGTCKIIMITNFTENGRPKCEKYWTETSCQYGGITVTLQNSASYADFVIRTFSVSKGKIIREVKHFHFTTWPDHSAPPCATPFLNFMNKTRSYRPDSDAPIVVHCSAGIGRTGTAILLDSMIDMGLREKHVDVVNHLCSMRKQRMNIVENLDQYTFVYNALVERFCIQDTSIKCADFKKKYEKLQSIDNATGVTSIEKQFQVLNKTPELTSKDVVAAYKSENQSKNRSMHVLPPDRARPCTSSYFAFYINAVYVDSYTKKNAFIATQYPLPNTIGDFWHMVCEVHSETIVVLQDMDVSKEENPPLWSQESAQLSRGFKIECESVTTEDDLKIANLNITLTTLKEPKKILSVNALMFQNWMTSDKLPSQVPSFLSLISRILHLQESKNHVITVVCSDGAVACGIFCDIIYICDQIKMEKIVDVFRATKCIRANRKQFITDAVQYKFLYDLVSAYLNSL